ncbi:MAG: hemerythrin domain-containing protein [Elusimicrobia bacterium]|nr:hemerythrin domain-containing protein [Candidatus Liberimonas magnetica]
MREHGVISRLLLIYEEIIKRINNNEVFPAEPLSQSTDIVSSFIQGYHEVLEEKYIFDRFRKTNNLAYMIAALEEQHKAGRKITYAIKAQQNAPDKNRLASSLRAFINMYRPHKAQEDTVLFPAFRNIVPPDEYAGLAEQFEKEEEIVFGKGGFKKVASQVEEIEKSLGINELSKFTP